MVKIAEKKVKRSPLLPILGMLLAAGLFAIAFGITQAVVIKIPEVKAMLGNPPSMINQLAFTFGIWFALLAVAYFLVAVVVGKGKTINDIPLPPRQKTKKPGRR